MSAAPRPQLSAEHLLQNHRQRVITGTAKAIAEHGYHAANVDQIVKACRTSRGTFYKCFGSKKAAAVALLDGFEIEELGEALSIDILLIEVAAFYHTGEVERASELLLFAERVIRSFAEAKLNSPPVDPQLLSTLPPGTHCLPPSFVVANQRARLLEGTAAVIVDRGFPNVRIADITAAGALSRRTFYEHFGSVADAARAMVEAVETTMLDPGVDRRSGLYAVAVEIVAQRIVDGDPPPPPPIAGAALTAVYALLTALEGPS